MIILCKMFTNKNMCQTIQNTYTTAKIFKKKNLNLQVTVE